jgi:heme exporter protein C
LRASIDDIGRADRASAVLALVGAVNLPIIHFSVEWWSSLHQGPTLVRAGGPAIEPAMLYPLLAMIFGFSLLYGALLLHRLRSEVLSRERRARWVRDLLLVDGSAAGRETA